jgi:hypothetical protein
MLPANVAIRIVPSDGDPPTAMPAEPAEIVPLLLMPPAKVVMPSSKIPLTAVASVPSFSIPPEKIVMSRASMASKPAEIVPVLVMPPTPLFPNRAAPVMAL